MLRSRAKETRVYQRGSWGQAAKWPPTVQHMIAECKMQAGKAYMEYHNRVAGILYRNIYTEHGVVSPKVGYTSNGGEE